MAIPIYLAANGGYLFNRIGHIQGRINDLLAQAGGTVTAESTLLAQLPYAFLQAQSDFALTPAWTSILDGLYASFVTTGQSNDVNLAGTLTAIVPTLIVAMANQDTPLAAMTLQNALQLLQTQMQGNYHVATAGAAAGAQTNVGTPIGTPTIVMSVLRGDGLSLEYIYPETITFDVASDQWSGATIYEEPYSVTGQQQALNLWQWPGGSGCGLSISAVDGTQSYPNGNNLLVNSNFATVTNANIPDNWINTGAGVISTDVLCNNSVGYISGSNSLQFVGNSGGTGNLQQVYQQLNTASSAVLGAGGTPYEGVERTPYAVNFWYKLSAGSPGAGVLTVALVNAAGTVINDDQAVANSYTIDLTLDAGTTWLNSNHVFRLPTNLPSEVRLQFKISTALSTGKTLYLDLVSLAQMTNLYGALPQGPYCAIFSSAVAPVVGDSWTVGMTTGMAVTTWQGAMQSLLNISQVAALLPGLGIRLQTTGGTLIPSAAVIA